MCYCVHMTIMFTSYYCVILCKDKSLYCAFALMSSGSMVTGSVFGRDELHTKYHSDYLKLIGNCEDWVVDW
jgi:hypothetical protein